MKYSNWSFMLAAAAFCMLVASPLTADAASSRHSANGQKISAEKKRSSRADARSSRHDAPRKKHASAHSSHKRHKADRDTKKSRKSKKSGQNRAQTRQSVENRDLWLQRAQESELMTGKASWYGSDAHGGATASGVNYDMYTFTAAHRTLPMGTVVRVTDQQNGKSVMVCVTDRGPFVRGRIIDLSYAAAQKIAIDDRGVGTVALEVVSDESGTPLKADEAFYVRYKAAIGDERVGPFRAFADAAAMHEALRQAHPEAEVVLGLNN
ncbi:MAG: septal ring lytic transglycosylase RlpA family protein [Desulfovibrio sp.]|nr:septal ring lytic transglycosylase RlpA family protein [Desulfovibrio sp.]